MLDYHYFPTSHWSRITSLVIAEKGLDVRRHFVDIRVNATFEPAYLTMNPKGVVPTLVDDGKVVCNGVRIAAHLDTVGGPALTRRDDPVVAQWSDTLADLPMMLFSYSVWVKGRKGENSKNILDDKIERAAQYAQRHPELADRYERKREFFEGFRSRVYDDAHVARQQTAVQGILDELSAIVATQDWIGEAYSFADCIALPVLYRLRDLELLDDWSRDPDHPLHGYYARLRAHPSYQAVFADDSLIP